MGGLALFHVFAILAPVAKIFYLGGGTHARGMLRAAVTIQQLESLRAPELVTHIGHDVPEVSDAPITLVEISSDEGTAIWPLVIAAWMQHQPILMTACASCQSRLHPHRDNQRKHCATVPP